MEIYFIALSVTIAVEYIVYLVFIRAKPFHLLMYAVLINCLTHPAAFYFYSKATFNNNITGFFNIYFIIIELIVFLTEIVPLKILLKIKFSKAVLISIAANSASALLGIII